MKLKKEFSAANVETNIFLIFEKLGYKLQFLQLLNAGKRIKLNFNTSLLFFSLRVFVQLSFRTELAGIQKVV